jgi:hypothetical protein
MTNNNNETQPWIDAIYKALEECPKENGVDYLIHYSEASNAFPDGPHEKMSDLNKLDFKGFSNWAKQIGWDVQFAPDNTEPGYEFAPEIRLTRMGHSAAE